MRLPWLRSAAPSLVDQGHVRTQLVLWLNCAPCDAHTQDVSPTERNTSSPYGDTSTSVVRRLAAVLDAFRAGDVYLGVNEIGRRIELSRSTVSRLVKEMHEARFLERKAGNAGLWVARPVRPGPAPALGRHRARRRPDRARRRCRTTSRSAVRSTARRTASRTRSPRRRGTPTSGSSRAIRSRRCATRECGRTHASPRGLSGCPSAGQQRQDLAAEAHRVRAALLE